MTTTQATDPFRTTIRGRAVRYWSVFEQVWIKCDAADIPDRDLATLSDDERRRIQLAAKTTGV